jgi:nicotinate-nucleotide adenylyltransferase
MLGGCTVSEVDEKILEETISKMHKVVQKLVKPSRYEHSLSTAEMAEKMCFEYGENPRLGYLAGLVHDICKDFDHKKMLALAKQDGNPISDIEMDKKSLLHGRAAAVFLETEYGFTNKDLLEAVKIHTFGAPGMAALGKILYAADKIEPTRPHVTKDRIESLFEKKLDDFVLSVLEEALEYEHSMGHTLAPITEKFLLSLIKGVNVK